MAEPAWTPQFACRRCASPLTACDSNALRCQACGAEIPVRDGIYRCLGASRLEEIEPLLIHYRRVRARDGYRQDSAAYYRSLPDVDGRAPQAATWRVRHESFRHLDRWLRSVGPTPLRILDLGAGSGWLSHRLTALGHSCVAVDWLDDAEDGLGAVPYYPVGFTCIQADFDDLPLAPSQFDVVIFNASLHYSTDPGGTLRRAREGLVPGGTLVVMDSPVFTTDEGGRRMLDAQQMTFRVTCEKMIRWGVGYLTESGLMQAASEAGLRVRWIPSRGGPGWALQRWFAGLKARRAPARFGIWFGSWRPASS